jgi:hypothetical protein
MSPHETLQVQVGGMILVDNDRAETSSVHSSHYANNINMKNSEKVYINGVYIFFKTVICYFSVLITACCRRKSTAAALVPLRRIVYYFPFYLAKYSPHRKHFT